MSDLIQWKEDRVNLPEHEILAMQASGKVDLDKLTANARIPYPGRHYRLIVSTGLTGSWMDPEPGFFLVLADPKRPTPYTQPFGGAEPIV